MILHYFDPQVETARNYFRIFRREWVEIILLNREGWSSETVGSVIAALRREGYRACRSCLKFHPPLTEGNSRCAGN